MQLLGVFASTALLALLGPTYVGAAKKPQINKKAFDSLPKSYFYFEDSPVILSLEDQSKIVWRSDDDGATWKSIEKIPVEKVLDIYPHPFDKKKAYVLTLGREHFVTSDQGKSWQKFETEWPPSLQRNPLSHHATKHNYVLYTGMKCIQDEVWRDKFFCEEKTWYTKDGFDSDPKELMEKDKKTHGCMFARSTPYFDKGSESSVLCIVNGAKPGAENWVLLVADDLSGPWKEPALDGFKEFSGVTGLASVKKFIVAAAKSAGTDEMSLFVSDDADNWDRAEFPSSHGGLKQGAYTILESTKHSLQVDVLTTWTLNPIGALFTSNSNGTYFTKNIDHTNRNIHGNVDFEQVANIQGIVLVNIVDNAEEVLKGNGNDRITKKIKSQISFDGGHTFKDLKTDKDDKLHVHSVTDARNGGRVFSSPAPGILLAVGNTGKYLSDYEHGDVYVSDDAGLTWSKTDLKGPHMYEFGDSGSILVAVADKTKTDKLRYSLNHGKVWESVDLDVELQVAALTTVPDSTAKKFTMIALGKDGKNYIFSFNFDGVLDRQCKQDDDGKKSDYEKWYARLDEKGNPDCLMGHKQFFYRRKKDADCFVNAEYKDPVPEEENCPCIDEDYECDFEFAAKDGEGKCELIGKLKVPEGACKKEGDTFKGSSGYRLIPGNTCTKGIKKDEEKEWHCDKGVKPPSSGKIKSVSKTFDDAGGFMEYYYLMPGSDASGSDETIVMRTDENKIYITHDQGAIWDIPKELKGQQINAIYPHPYNNDIVFFTTPSKKFFYSIDRGQTIQEGQGPDPPTRRDDIPLALRFHPTRSDYMIWISDRDCGVPSSKACHAAAYYTNDRGRTWRILSPYVKNCAWVHSKVLVNTPEKLIFCERYAKDERPSDANPIKLVASDDFFKTETTHFEKIIGFATMEEFIVAAVVKDELSLKLDASVDGKIFAEAHFPHNFQVDKQQAYTLLDSVTHAIFVHVTVNPMRGSEYGAILKSNSNGTSYVLSLSDVNRNEAGFVDFEKMQGLEGVAIVNVVVNVDETNKGGKKKLKSKITHNDGGAWNYLPPPEKDVDGKSYDCNVKDLEKCSLNLHGYTERKDPRHTFSSGSAVGVLVGVGNVGEYLTSKSDGNTYITRDGGVTWKEIRKGSYMWEYGDQGSIILIVDEDDPTDIVYYTLDEGETWNEYKFGDKMHVTDITTIPSDTSRKFLLWGNPVGKGGKAITVQIDFTGLTDKQCQLPEDPNDKDSDFVPWEPQHPNLDAEHACLFGHNVQYYRKKTDRLCYVGPKGHEPIESKKCPCGKHDFECDFNYERGNDGRCHLVSGLEKPDHKESCAKNQSLIEWYEPTGYRKIPLTKCVGGMELDKGKVKPCRGHEKEFNERHGPSGWAIFFGIIFALTVSGAIGWYVWNRWTGKFGAIRLGEDSSGEQSPLVRYPIIVISAVIAVAVAIPAIIQLAVEWVASKLSRPKRFTTRGSFARGNYAVVNDDDGELLGSDEDDEV